MYATRCVIPVIKSPKDYQVYRISPNDSNRLAIIFDSTNANTSLTCCIEIFDVGGQTPPNRHQWAVEMFLSSKEKRSLCVTAKVPRSRLEIVY